MSENLIDYSNFQPDWWDAAGITAVMIITLSAIFSNPVWRENNSIIYVGKAQVPILWDFDKSYYASPSNDRFLI